jgi:hypothetical protein
MFAIRHYEQPTDSTCAERDSRSKRPAVNEPSLRGRQCRWGGVTVREEGRAGMNKPKTNWYRSPPKKPSCRRALDELQHSSTSTPGWIRRKGTDLPGPAHRLLRLGRHARLAAELVADPLLQQERLELAVRERVREVPDEPERGSHERVRAVLVPEAAVDEVEDGLRVVLQEVGCEGRVRPRAPDR